jgi:hypothetical protein
MLSLAWLWTGFPLIDVFIEVFDTAREYCLQYAHGLV